MSVKKKHVIGITGIRSEYFLQKSVYSAINKHPELKLKLIVTGAHLSPLHNYTVRDIECDGFEIIEKVESLLWSNTAASRAKGAALQMVQIAHILEREQPDWVLAPCDREEAMTMALCASYLNIPIIHLAAGDRVVGNVDDMIRHAVSRLSHLLLVTNEDAKERLLRAGEQDFRVHNVGHPGLDRLRKTQFLSKKDVAIQLGIGEITEDYIVVIQHVISSEINEVASQIEETMKAVEKLNMLAVVVYPNSDPGCQDIVSIFNDYRDKSEKIYCFESISDNLFVNTLRHAFVLVGNSSLGILEAPFLGLPVINVGNRQKNRFHVDNVVFLPHDSDLIAGQINQWRDDPLARDKYAKCQNPFGDGNTGECVANIIASTDITEPFLNKDLSY